MEADLVTKIMAALNSKKCTAHGPFHPGYAFEDLLREYPEADLTKMYVPLLVEATGPDLSFPGQLGPAKGNLYCVYVPYSHIPGLVDDENVIRIGASACGKFLSGE